MVIEWFKNLAEKQKRKFIKFDMAEFYPSNSEDLLTKLIMLNYLQLKKMASVQ